MPQIGLSDHVIVYVKSDL